jgi:hypothetical protein
MIMGGASCQIIIRSLVRFSAVPTSPGQQHEFEAQIRKCYANPTIAEAVALEPDGRWKKICETLAKTSPLSMGDLTILWEGLDEYIY